MPYRAPDAYVSIARAAREIGLSRHLLLMSAVKGECDIRPVAGRLVMLRSEVDRMKRERGAEAPALSA